MILEADYSRPGYDMEGDYMIKFNNTGLHFRFFCFSAHFFKRGGGRISIDFHSDFWCKIFGFNCRSFSW